MALGLHKAAGYYYFPGFHEPGTGSAVGINKKVWESLDPSDQKIISAVAASEYARSLAEFNANNALSLRKLRQEGSVKILKFDDSVLRALHPISKDVVAEATWNRGVDRFITTMGVGDGALISKALAMTAKMGRLVVTNIHPMAENSVSVNMMDLTLTQKQIVGTLYGSANPRADIPKLLELAACGQVDLDAVVSNTYPLEAINDGYADMRTGRFLRGVLRYPAAG